MNRTRINLGMTSRDVVIELSDGNPGALRICLDILVKASEIDPDGALGGLGALLCLDQEGIYGPHIWMLFKDVCGQDLTKMLACLRAVQLGGLAGVTSAALRGAIESRGAGVDVDSALAAVKAKLPRFGATVAAVAP